MYIFVGHIQRFGLGLVCSFINSQTGWVWFVPLSTDRQVRLTFGLFLYQQPDRLGLVCSFVNRQTG